MFNYPICEDGTRVPEYRHRLKAAIHYTGHRHVKAFAKKNGISHVLLSRVVCGWQFPSPDVQKSLAKGLGISLHDLQNLL